MRDSAALKAAVDLFYLPSQVRAMRSLPLPKGTELLLRLAAGDDDAAREAQVLSDRPPHANRQAAIFFIEQVLFSPDADNYRTLGLDHTATAGELRAHMALLLKWLRPDLGNDDYRLSMARRVIQAWAHLKTPERRLHHDDVHPPLDLRAANDTTNQPRSYFTPGLRRARSRTAPSAKPLAARARMLRRVLSVFLRLAKGRLRHHAKLQ